MTAAALPADCFLEPIRVATQEEEEQSTWSRNTPGAFWVWRCKAKGPGCKGEVVVPRVAVERGDQKSCGCRVRQLAAARGKALAANGQLFKKRQASIVLGERDGRPVVNGKQKKPLTNAQYDIVKALVVAGKFGLSKDQLDAKSGRGDALKTLRRLVSADSDWAAVVVFPGVKGQGYRVKL